jgi:hypothetical protein
MIALKKKKANIEIFPLELIYVFPKSKTKHNQREENNPEPGSVFSVLIALRILKWIDDDGQIQHIL